MQEGESCSDAIMVVHRMPNAVAIGFGVEGNGDLDPSGTRYRRVRRERPQPSATGCAFIPRPGRETASYVIERRWTDRAGAWLVRPRTQF